MQEEMTEFDDPQLKAAIARLRGGHVARTELVDRVRQSLAEAVEADGRPLQNAQAAFHRRPAAGGRGVDRPGVRARGRHPQGLA